MTDDKEELSALEKRILETMVQAIHITCKALCENFPGTGALIMITDRKRNLPIIFGTLPHLDAATMMQVLEDALATVKTQVPHRHTSNKIMEDADDNSSETEH